MIGSNRRSKHVRLSAEAASIPCALASDERWTAAQRIAASAGFSRSPLLASFLLYVVAEAIQGNAEGITEHSIGVRVFERPEAYRTAKDNIVRNYARRLRKRLAEYYEGEGSDAKFHIVIPLGGYVPTFRATQQAETPVSASIYLVPAVASADRTRSGRRRRSWKMLLLLIYSCVVAAVTWYLASFLHGYLSAQG